MRYYGKQLSVSLKDGYMLLRYPNIGRRIIVEGTDTFVFRNLRDNLEGREYQQVLDLLILDENYPLIVRVIRALERSLHFPQGRMGKRRKLDILSMTHSKLTEGTGIRERKLEEAIVLIERKIAILEARTTKKIGRDVFKGKVKGVGLSVLAYEK